MYLLQLFGCITACVAVAALYLASTSLGVQVGFVGFASTPLQVASCTGSVMLCAGRYQVKKWSKLE